MLPIVNAPTYELKLPSNGKKVKYRPFLVKEQKILLIALQSGDMEAIYNAVVEITDACTFNKLDVNSMPYFDLEHLFINLRSVSIGEVLELQIECGNCEKTTPYSLDLTTFNMEGKKPDSFVKLTDTIGVTMRYPTEREMVGVRKKESVEDVYKLVATCIESVWSGDEEFKASDAGADEVMKFLDGLTDSQFKKLEAFFVNMPKLMHRDEIECPHCQTKNTIVIEGLHDFFV